MSWRDIIKASNYEKAVANEFAPEEMEKKLTPKQKKLDNNHNGVIDAQDFHIMNGAEKKSCGPNCNCSSCGETEKLSFGANEQCDVCGNMFPNMRALDRHEKQQHSGSKSSNAFTARD